LAETGLNDAYLKPLSRLNWSPPQVAAALWYAHFHRLGPDQLARRLSSGAAIPTLFFDLAALPPQQIKGFEAAACALRAGRYAAELDTIAADEALWPQFEQLAVVHYRLSPAQVRLVCYPPDVTLAAPKTLDQPWLEILENLSGQMIRATFNQ
jgi:hypothetical protein